MVAVPFASRFSRLAVAPCTALALSVGTVGTGVAALTVTATPAYANDTVPFAADAFTAEEYGRFLDVLRTEYRRAHDGFFSVDFTLDGGKKATVWFKRSSLYLEGWSTGGTFYHFKGAEVPPAFKGPTRDIGFGGNYDALGIKNPGGFLGKKAFAKSLTALGEVETLLRNKGGFPKQQLGDLIQLGPEMARFDKYARAVKESWSGGGWKVPADFIDTIKKWDDLTKLAEGSGKPVTIGGTTLTTAEQAEEILGDGARWRPAGGADTDGARPSGTTAEKQQKKKGVRERAEKYGQRAEAKLPAGCGKKAGKRSKRSVEAAVSCMTADWEAIEKDLREEAEGLVRDKVAVSQELGEDIKLTPNLEAAKESNSFFVPYEKTRGILAEEISLSKAGSRVGHTAGAALWIAGLAEAFSHDTSGLDKATAVTAPVPVLGNLLGIADSVDHKDFAGATVNTGVLLAELAEILGISEEAGPIGLFLGGLYAVLATGPTLQDEMKQYDAIVEQRDKVWADGLSQQTKELATSGSAPYAQLYFQLVKGQALQSATVRSLTALAEARATTAKGSTPDAGRLFEIHSQLSQGDAFKKMDGELDASLRRTAAQLRAAVTKKLKEAQAQAWDSDQAKEFNTRYVAAARDLRSRYTCPDNGWAHGGAACFGYEREQDDLLSKALTKFEKAPAGLSDAQIGQILNDSGWPKFNPVVEDGYKLPRPSGVGADAGIWHRYGQVWWDAPSEDLPQGTEAVLKDLSNGTETTYKPGKQMISQNRPGDNSRNWEVFYRWKSPEGKTIESERVRVGMTCNLVKCWGTGGS